MPPSYTRKPMSQRLAPFVVVSVLLATAASAQTQTQPPVSTPSPASQPAASVPPPPHTSTGLPANISTLSSSDLPRLIPILDRIKTKMDDWPQLGRYQAANMQLASAAAGEAR